MDVVANIKAIRLKKGINQSILADALSVDNAVISNIERGTRELKVNELEVISKCLGVTVLDLFTYPKRYVDADTITSTERVSVTFEVPADKREYLLKLVTGDK